MTSFRENNTYDVICLLVPQPPSQILYDKRVIHLLFQGLWQMLFSMQTLFWGIRNKKCLFFIDTLIPMLLMHSQKSFLSRYTTVIHTMNHMAYPILWWWSSTLSSNQQISIGWILAMGWLCWDWLVYDCILLLYIFQDIITAWKFKQNALEVSSLIFLNAVSSSLTHTYEMYV